MNNNVSESRVSTPPKTETAFPTDHLQNEVFLEINDQPKKRSIEIDDLPKKRSIEIDLHLVFSNETPNRKEFDEKCKELKSNLISFMNIIPCKLCVQLIFIDFNVLHDHGHYCSADEQFGNFFKFKPFIVG